MNSTALNCTSLVLQYNGDIAGRGVRISFYIQNLILVLLVRRSKEDAENALWTLIATSFGLTFAAWEQVVIKQLTLLQGILVSQLAWLAICGMNLGLASYTDAKGNDNVVKVATVLQTYFSMISTLVMWIKAPDLPPFNCPSRGEIKLIVMFGLPLPALGSGRVAALVVAALLLALYTISTAYEIFFWIKLWNERKRRNKRRSLTERPPTRTHVHPESEAGGRREVVRRSGRPSWRTENFGLEKFNRFRQRWRVGNVDSVFLAIVILQIVISVYFIATIELAIVKNHAVLSDTSVWGFGQILAIIVVIPSLLALYRATREQFSSQSSEGHTDIALSEHNYGTVPNMPREPSESLERDRGQD